MASLLFKAQSEIENAMKKEDGINGVGSGFTELDKITSGWQKSDMIVVAARPGMGKTAFVLSMARNVAVIFQHPVAIFSLEMSSIMTNECSICCEPYTKMMRKEIECFNCEKSTCSSCVKRYILDSLTEAKCLHCNIQWDRRFMVNNLTKKFCDIDYRQHRIKVLHFRYEHYLPYISRIMSMIQN